MRGIINQRVSFRNFANMSFLSNVDRVVQVYCLQEGVHEFNPEKERQEEELRKMTRKQQKAGEKGASS